jgi:thiamine biosynthesis lipoprotein
MHAIAVARNAMATRFEIVLHGENAATLRAAGEEALDEIDRVEGQLSLYRPTSEVAHVNGRAAKNPVRVTPALLQLLQEAQRLSRETGGAFDITIAPLVRCWGFMGGMGRLPQPEEVAEARAKIGMSLVELNLEDSTVKFGREGVMLDLGAIGKGFALERAAGLLREAGVTSALLNAGTSTVYAVGHPPGQEHWKIAVEPPPGSVKGQRPSLLATVPLRDEALSVSAVWGRSFQADGKTFGHVLDPRSGMPVKGGLLSAVSLPSAMETDALSTALLVLGEAGLEMLARIRPGVRTLVVSEEVSAKGFRASGRGIRISL